MLAACRGGKTLISLSDNKSTKSIDDTYGIRNATTHQRREQTKARFVIYIAKLRTALVKDDDDDDDNVTCLQSGAPDKSELKESELLKDSSDEIASSRHRTVYREVRISNLKRG